ncbi:DUF429 domain-containing protein [Halobacillus trueperi]|uniref:DUF429 domain-containing protein n=1 Tax=Halobacillus trueperi TaxID=156205 RepID=A0A3E0JC49_9BACI|nr:DUF429 domain-containing protein [Halobacillus trueperi]REJ10440.1 DUF429 domain-containing protein [Halobacillus trueperi]
MQYIGIDLSGPSNTKDTVLVHFQKQKGKLSYKKHETPMNDHALITYIESLANKDSVTIGVDAPLSYEDGGGDRESDRSLRAFVTKLGMKGASIMPPTMMRMVYLSLRGIRFTREIERLSTKYEVHIVEVHPGAALGARMETIDDVLHYKQDLTIRKRIRRWFETHQLLDIPEVMAQESHTIDACAAALAAWHWQDPNHEPAWLYKASLPLHPYDFCC